MDFREITYEQIEKACESLITTDIKGKEYVQVNERVKAFRKLYPTGYILTEMISHDNGMCVMKATVGFYVYQEDGSRIRHDLAYGEAYEKEGNGYINKTSYIENCETSAVGRALGFAGIGIDVSIASSEEVENAQLQQTKAEIIKPQEAEVLRALCEDANIDINKLCKQYKVKSLEDMNKEQYTKICRMIGEWNEKQRAEPDPPAQGEEQMTLNTTER